jgi:hypothetical protein
MCNLLVHVFQRILKDIDISATDRPTHGPPDPAPEPTTDEFDLFQGDFISYSQLMSQMSLDLGARTFGTQYDAPHASLYDTPGLSTRVPETQPPADARHERPHHCTILLLCFVFNITHKRKK